MENSRKCKSELSILSKPVLKANKFRLGHIPLSPEVQIIEFEANDGDVVGSVKSIRVGFTLKNQKIYSSLKGSVKNQVGDWLYKKFEEMIMLINSH